MPIYRFSICTSTSFYLIWNIEESSSALYLQLPPQFVADFHSRELSSKDRIRQSLAVRVALYALLQKLALPIFPLSRNAQGRPCLVGSTLHITFTHSRYLAAVALSTTFPIGIDLELVKPSLHRVQERFLTAVEMIDANHGLEKLAIYWCAKEALYKRLDKQPICKAICIEPFQCQAKGRLIAHLHQERYTMAYERIVDGLLPLHVLAYCTN